MVGCVYGGTTSSFVYGSDGIRRQSTVGTKTTDYVTVNSLFVREVDHVTNAVAATYLSGPRGPEYRRDDSTGAVRWYAVDALGSVLCETDNSGNVTASRKYDVYGAVRSNTGTSTTSHKYVGMLGHASEDNTGLVYMQARYMDPTTGRFCSEDSYGDGANPFGYAHAAPVGLSDVDGHIILGGAIAITEGMDVEATEGAGAEVAYSWITNRIAAAVGTSSAGLALELLDTDPDAWSHGAYEWIKEAAILLIRLNGTLPKAEIAATFCREIAEFLQREECGSCFTADLWNRWGPEMYDQIMKFFE
jgi:RHS repeat-associated protein